MFRTIVVGTDGSDTAAEAVRQAAELASTFGARLHVVSAYKPVSKARQTQERAAIARAFPGEGVEWVSNAQADVEAILTDTAFRVRGQGVEVETHARPGDPAEAVVVVAEEVGADLVVVGNKGMKGARRILGSVPNTVSHQAPCSVMIVATT